MISPSATNQTNGSKESNAIKIMLSLQAIRSNNIGVELFEIGLFEQAIVKFRVAVEQLSTLLTSDNESSIWTLPTNASVQIQYNRPIVGWSKPARGGRRVLAGSQNVRVYKRAAYLNPNFCPFGIATYTTASLLNLGLCNHMIALRDDSSTHLQRASKIYESIMASLEECCPLEDTNFLLLHLALHTNCGHILSHYCKESRALGCFETSCRILTWLHVLNASTLVLDETEIEGLMLNMEALMEHKTCFEEVGRATGAAAA